MSKECRMILMVLVSIMIFIAGCGGGTPDDPANTTCGDGICQAMGEDEEVCPDDCAPNTTYGVFITETQSCDPLLELNCRTARINVPWSEIEPTKGDFDFSISDEFLSLLGDTDVEIVATIKSVSDWATATGEIAGPPIEMDDYRAFIRQLAVRYKNQINYWQIGNEINGAGFWAGTKEDYLDLLKNANEVIKVEDPDAKIVVAGFMHSVLRVVSGDKDATQQQLDEANAFFHYIMNDCSPYFDVIDFHQYHDYDVVEAEVALIRDAMGLYGYDVEIINTEAGDLDFSVMTDHTEGVQQYSIANQLLGISDISDAWDFINADQELTTEEKKQFGQYMKEHAEAGPILERYQAENLIKRAVITAGARISKFNMLCMSDKENPRDWFGKQMCLTDVNSRKKPMYYAYDQLISRVATATKTTKINTDPWVFKYTFGDGGSLFIAWDDDGGTLDLSAHLSSQEATLSHIVTELENDLSPIYTPNELVPVSDIPLSVTPVFILTQTVP